MTLTKVFRVDPLSPDEHVLDYCCKEVLKGAIIVFPTETVYGLGAHAFDANAVRKVFIAKGRPADNPLIVHISSMDQIYDVVEDVPDIVIEVFKRFWPGPLTLILRKSKRVPPEVSGGLPTVAVRVPGHPVALKLVECTGPIAAPSANISGRPSPTEPHHVYADMFGRVDIILDAGSTFFGVESTVVDIASDPPRLLRPGAFPYEKLSELLGKDIVVPDFARGFTEGAVALAPGVKYKHYSPRTQLIVVETDDYGNLEEYVENVIRIAKSKCISKKCAVLASKETAKSYEALGFKVIILGSRQNLYEVAKNLFQALRDIDRLGVDIGIVEGFPEVGIGMAIMNRLRKASGHNIVIV